jgi:hypothetical protein
MILTAGRTAYRLIAVERDGYWTAYAERVEDAARFGIDVTADSAEEARRRLASWLEWQHAHMEALTALRDAERLYHRALAGAAFGTVEPSPVNGEVTASLERVNDARSRLDDVRGRRPTV